MFLAFIQIMTSDNRKYQVRNTLILIRVRKLKWCGDSDWDRLFHLPFNYEKKKKKLKIPEVPTIIIACPHGQLVWPLDEKKKITINKLG